MSDTRPKTSKLTEHDVINASEEEYMNADQLEFFRIRLLDLYAATQERINEAKDQIHSPMDCSDPNDRATIEEQSTILMRIVDREQKLLPKIRQSLERIRLGEYGYCLESGEPIGVQRLLVRPTAEYCAELKALKEVKEHQFRG